MININYFASGKIYQDSDSGKIVTGYFSTSATSNRYGEIAELINSISEAVANEFDCDVKQVHIENLNKL